MTSAEANYSLIGENSSLLKKPDLSRYIIFGALLILVFFCTLVGLYLVEYPRKITKRNFTHYQVEYEVAKNRPFRSIQTSWVPNVGKRPNDNFQEEKDFTNIENKDFVGSGFDKGHLSPWAILGPESMSILNMVPNILTTIEYCG